jgi:dihydrofolate reductase
LKNVSWNNTTLKSELDKEEIVKLKEQEGKPIGVGSPSMIVQLGNLGLIDEYQLCIQPIVLGSGLPLFKNITGRIDLTLLKTKTFGCGAVIHYYQPKREKI